MPATATSLETPVPKKRRSLRPGGVSKTERTLIQQAVANSAQALSPEQVKALAVITRRTPATIRSIVADARMDLAEAAKDYVEIHKQATEQALANGDAKSLEVARKGAAWAITNISVDGQRIVEKPNTEPSGTRIFVGIRVGGLDTSVLAPQMTAETLESGPAPVEVVDAS